MKKKLLLPLMLAGLFLCGFSYPKSTVVTNIEDDIVTCTDTAGNIWQFEGAEDYHVGAICSMIISDENTPEIYDDIILEHQYDGVSEWFDLPKSYIICDVVRTVETELGTRLTCVMQNGDLEHFYAYDTPEDEISTVCFVTYNPDDYSFYEIVALK